MAAERKVYAAGVVIFGGAPAPILFCGALNSIRRDNFCPCAEVIEPLTNAPNRDGSLYGC